MSDILFNQYGRLNDSMERALMQRALANGEAVSITAVFASLAKLVKKVAVRSGRYIISATNALNEARARDAKYCGAFW